MSDAKAEDIIIGIDLGTTNSLVAYADAKGPRLLAAEDEAPNIPSVVRIDPVTDEVVIGDEARSRAVEFPLNTIFSVKRLMGRGIADMAADLDYLPYEVVEGENNTARVKVGEKVYSAQAISAMILTALKKRAEQQLGQPVKKAVITVPAYFDDAQRQATRDAGRLAGLEVMRIVNEPTAAALAYDIDRQQNATIAVYDLGGGTFDISILKLENGVFQVLSTAGDTHLGGDDVDRALVELIQEEIREQFGADLDFPPATRQAFRTFAEATKIRLSNEPSADVEVGLGEDRTYMRTITKEELEAMVKPLGERSLECCARALKDASLKAADIDHVVMVGGSTRIPLIRQMVGEFFDSTPYTALNPDLVVALGAAVQASIIAGINREALLLDVIPLSLGIETMGGAVAKLITRNSTVPAVAKEQFSTYVDGQTNVKINVLQGERELVEDCRQLGEFDLKGIPPMPAGLPKIEVTFMVDANGILTVSAIEKRSEKYASIQIVPNHGLSREEVDAMEAASYEFALEDMNAHRLIDLRNQAKLDMRQIKRQLEKVGGDLEASKREEIDAHLATVDGFLGDKSPDLDAFYQAITDMDHATINLAELAIAKTLRDEGLSS